MGKGDEKCNKRGSCQSEELKGLEYLEIRHHPARRVKEGRNQEGQGIERGVLPNYRGVGPSRNRRSGAIGTPWTHWTHWMGNGRAAYMLILLFGNEMGSLDP